MYNFVIDGQKYELIPADKEWFYSEYSICKKYKAWMCDQEVTRYNSHGLFKKTREEIDRWLDSIDGINHLCFAVYKLYDDGSLGYGEWVGIISLQNINQIYRSAEIALWIGDKTCWGKGIATKIVNIVCDHGFLKMNLNRILSGTAQSNVGMRKAFSKVWIEQEGILRDGMFLDGKYCDIICYAYIAKRYFVNNERRRKDGD